MDAESDGHSQMEWRKSRFSADQGNCVEISAFDISVFVRDSKNIAGPSLRMSRAQWSRLLQDARNSQPRSR
jgi:hypothetical protein